MHFKLETNTTTTNAKHQSEAPLKFAHWNHVTKVVLTEFQWFQCNIFSINAIVVQFKKISLYIHSVNCKDSLGN